MEQELKNKFEAIFNGEVKRYGTAHPEKYVSEAMHSAYTLAKSEDAERIKELEERVSDLEKAINYALPLLTNTPPQHRKEFHSTARAALKKALNPKP